jgi:glycosyltransferase involved in cell wall biosynthesis
VPGDDALREDIRRAEERFAARDGPGALVALEQVRCAARASSPVWAEAMADIAVVLHAEGALYDALAHARRALEASPELEEARETVEVCARALGQAIPSPGDHVLVVVDHFAPSRGGTELLAGDLARSLMRLGRPVEVLCRPHPRRGADPDGIPVHEMQPAFGDRALAGLLTNDRFGAVIGISGPMGFPVLGLLRQPALLARLRSLVVPCVNEEFDGVVRASSGFLRDYARSLFRVDAVGYSSRDGWDRRLLDELGVPGVYLPNAVPCVAQSGSIRETLEVARSVPIILHVANFWPQKNHLAFLEQMRGLPGDWRLVCIGGPSADHPQLAREVAIAAARDPRVVLFGEATREEVAGAMAQADVLVLPSIAEATPLVLLEAMSHGLPWIVSDTCRSAADLAGGSIASPAAFAAELERMLADPVGRKALGAAGRRTYLEGYSWEVVGPRYLEAVGGRADGALPHAA